MILCLPIKRNRRVHTASYSLVKPDAWACAPYDSELSSRNIRTEKLQFASGHFAEGPGANLSTESRVYVMVAVSITIALSLTYPNHMHQKYLKQSFVH